MNMVRKRWIFGIAVVAGMSLVLATAAIQRWQRPPPAKVSRLSGQIAVAEQLSLDQIPELGQRGYATIIDLRPDGEAPDQPSASAVRTRARKSSMRFAYVPVPHGDIPASAVDALQQAIADNPSPVLLYCRSGRRAARTWSLVEASRQDGASGDAILAAVKASGQSADDLAPAIRERIARRAPASAPIQ